MADSRYVIFRLGGDTFEVDISLVREVIYPIEIFKIPNSHEHLAGLINLRGRIHAVIDVARKLGLTPCGGGKSRMVLISRVPEEADAHSSVGFVVDEVLEIKSFGRDSLEDAAYSADREIDEDLTSKAAKYDDRIVFILNAAALCRMFGRQGRGDL